MLCAVIKTPDISAIEEANRQAELIELRLDEMGPLTFMRVKELRCACRVPVIFKGDAHVVDWLSCAPDYVDLSLETPLQMFEEIKTAYPHLQRICSWHDFEGTPERLETVFSRPAEIYKVVTTAKNTLDALRMLAFVKESSKPVIGLCMGEEGVITRILGPLFGSPFTYAPIDETHLTAPGQLLLKELKYRYHYSSLHLKTALYGLIGDPVAGSPSHHTHNFAFDRLSTDAIYVKLRVKKEELSSFFPLAMKLGFQGFSVTMPLKEAVLPFLNNVHDKGAVNTIRVKEGKLEGWNTDGKGALAALEKKSVVLCKKVVILGAGGAARAIAKEALRRGASVILLNRTWQRAQSVANELGCECGKLSDFPTIAQKGYDILINCTPLGMNGDQELPVDAENLLRNKIVMDAVLHPSLTPFLTAAQQKNCRIITGMDFFIQQAIEQFCLWFSECLRE